MIQPSTLIHRSSHVGPKAVSQCQSPVCSEAPYNAYMWVQTGKDCIVLKTSLHVLAEFLRSAETAQWIMEQIPQRIGLLL